MYKYSTVSKDVELATVSNPISLATGILVVAPLVALDSYLDKKQKESPAPNHNTLIMVGLCAAALAGGLLVCSREGPLSQSIHTSLIGRGILFGSLFAGLEVGLVRVLR